MVGFSSPECSKLSFPGRTAGQQDSRDSSVTGECHRSMRVAVSSPWGSVSAWGALPCSPACPGCAQVSQAEPTKPQGSS